MSSSTSTRKLLKLKYELDSLDLETKRMGVKIQQFRVGLLAFGLELKRKKKVEEPIASTEEIHTQEHNEVNFDLPPKFDEYEDQEEEIVEEVVDVDQSACEAFILLDSPQKCELEPEVQSLFLNWSCNEIQEVDWNSPPNFDTYEEQKDDDDQRCLLYTSPSPRD